MSENAVATAKNQKSQTVWPGRSGIDCLTFRQNSFGGVPEAIRQLANGTGKHGVNSEVFTISPQVREQRFTFEKHHVIQASSNFEVFSTPFSIDAVSKFKIYSKKFDLIHYHYPYPFGDVLKLLVRTERRALLPIAQKL